MKTTRYSNNPFEVLVNFEERKGVCIKDGVVFINETPAGDVLWYINKYFRYRKQRTLSKTKQVFRSMLCCKADVSVHSTKKEANKMLCDAYGPIAVGRLASFLYHITTCKQTERYSAAWINNRLAWAFALSKSNGVLCDKVFTI